MKCSRPPADVAFRPKFIPPAVSTCWVICQEVSHPGISLQLTKKYRHLHKAIQIESGPSYLLSSSVSLQYLEGAQSDWNTFSCGFTFGSGAVPATRDTSAVSFWAIHTCTSVCTAEHLSWHGDLIWKNMRGTRVGFQPDNFPNGFTMQLQDSFTDNKRDDTEVGKSS